MTENFCLAASETLEIRQDSCKFLPCQTKNFLANLHTVTYWYSFLLPNRKVGRNICHVLRLPLFTAASK
ncbi:MAG: hypothetical protein K2P15_06510, partial [Oscillospiraceae bacterium]|nr:hypothetical protein [Oscillospiraceae bacterium]